MLAEWCGSEQDGSCLLLLFLQVVLAAVRAEGLGEPVALPPALPTHLHAHLVAVVDAEGGDAVALVEPGGPLHDLRLLRRLPGHRLDAGEVEVAVEEARQPHAPQLRRVQVGDALDEADEGHVWNQRVDGSPAIC